MLFPAASVCAEGLLALAAEAERRRDFPAAASCLEPALRPPHAVALLLLAEARARFRLASLIFLVPRGSSSPRAGEVTAWQARAQSASQSFPFAYAGARRIKGQLAIHDRVFDVCESAAARGRCALVDCSHGVEGSITYLTAAKLVTLFTSARFCLQPGGARSLGGPPSTPSWPGAGVLL